ncbi:predicted protein [Chaetoceros tenuissimus]|uniref:Uncharacterized protein n=1 Tax=Chaetoceros tenuissimus TaxID=426638 RepID=A0AAD3D3M8_9STRA|nr:predicted protein [Chaetoceros tenuissimus]
MNVNTENSSSSKDIIQKTLRSIGSLETLMYRTALKHRGSISEEIQNQVDSYEMVRDCWGKIHKNKNTLLELSSRKNEELEGILRAMIMSIPVGNDDLITSISPAEEIRAGSSFPRTISQNSYNSPSHAKVKSSQALTSMSGNNHHKDYHMCVDGNSSKRSKTNSAGGYVHINGAKTEDGNGAKNHRSVSTATQVTAQKKTLTNAAIVGWRLLGTSIDNLFYDDIIKGHKENGNNYQTTAMKYLYGEMLDTNMAYCKSCMTQHNQGCSGLNHLPRNRCCCCTNCFQMSCNGSQDPKCPGALAKLMIYVCMREGLVHTLLRKEWNKICKDKPQIADKLPTIPEKNGRIEFNKFCNMLEKNHTRVGEPPKNPFNKYFWVAVKNTGIFSPKFFSQLQESPTFNDYPPQDLKDGDINKIRDGRKSRTKKVQDALLSLMVGKK